MSPTEKSSKEKSLQQFDTQVESVELVKRPIFAEILYYYGFFNLIIQCILAVFLKPKISNFYVSFTALIISILYSATKTIKSKCK